MLRRIRYVGLVIVAIGAIAPIAPAATTFPGSVTLTSPVRDQAAAGEVEVAWTWRSGSLVRSTSKVDLAVTQNGVSWYTIGAGVPIRTGTQTWDTATWPDGVYAVRAVVSRTSVKSVVSPMMVDNTAPQVRITRPSEGEVLVENERMIFFAAVVGTATLEADARDGLSGVGLITWLLDGEKIGEGTPFEYNFSTKPGRHVLRADAADRAGNSAGHEITLIAAPGPSATEGELPIPEDLPVPDPLPVPSLPVPGEIPGEAPPVDGLPDPDALVDSLPTD